MTGNTQKLSIRLLRDGIEPSDAVRDSVTLADWPQVEGAKIELGTMGGNPPKWAKFLQLTDAEKAAVFNNTAFGLIFLKASGRWFALSFGMGHVKLDPSKFEQDFGLKVVLNAVDPRRLKSADIRTPDENTLSRRSQTSRGSDQTAFAIDVERDIVRGLAGTPKDATFASRVAGSDALSLDRKMTAADLPTVCAQAHAIYQKSDYKAEFGWIDQIRHVRDDTTIALLDAKVAAALDAAVKENGGDGLHLAYPVIYDPERAHQIRYKGFRSGNHYPDLDIAGYLDALTERGKHDYTVDDLRQHSVHEVDDDGNDCGSKWSIYECLVFEAVSGGDTYVLSGGRWYKIASDLIAEVQAFFAKVTHYSLPPAQQNENEDSYNKRVAALGGNLICLDKRLIKPAGATSLIEVCDFLSNDRRLIHVKDKTSSSRLSHLFAQGTVSARVLKIEGGARDLARNEIQKVESKTGASGFVGLIPASTDPFRPEDFTVVYAVIVGSAKPCLPFFSLVSFRQAARELQALGYSFAFAWITKPPATARKKNSAKTSAAELGPA